VRKPASTELRITYRIKHGSSGPIVCGVQHHVIVLSKTGRREVVPLGAIPVPLVGRKLIVVDQGLGTVARTPMVCRGRIEISAVAWSGIWA
jgi:hypothetical protein